jgi:hypothetical protein
MPVAAPPAIPSCLLVCVDDSPKLDAHASWPTYARRIVRQLDDLGWQGIGGNVGGSPSFLSQWAGSLLEVAAAARDPPSFVLPLQRKPA